MSAPWLTSLRFRKISLGGALLVVTACLLMGYFISESYQAPVKRGLSVDEVENARRTLERGTPQQRRAALLQLIAAKAETELIHCLTAADPATVQMAISGLWECWLSEEGTEARQTMDEGIAAMNGGDLERATAIFSGLMTRHPHWAEAINKQATAFYLQGRVEESIALCKKVVVLKPDHFGAWNGMALCAIQTEDWVLALHAVRESLRLQPKSPSNLQLLKLVQSRLPQV